MSEGRERDERLDKMRGWLGEHRPTDLPADLGDRFERLRAWQRELYEAGWLGLGWPERYGGQGGDIFDRVMFEKELAASGAPAPVGLIGLEIVGPTILHHGTESQKERFIPTLLRADDIWCQGFSEPEAGSDLANLKTRAEYDGEQFIVSGQKVWTSWAQFADRCAVLARTDPTAERHRGISYLLMDLDQPGVEVHPLEQITGEAEFCEVFFDEAFADESRLLGELHQGWSVAMQTLSFERGPYAIRRHTELRVELDELIQDLVVAAGDPTSDAILVNEVGYLESLMSAMAAQTTDILRRMGDNELGAESSADKLFLTEVEQRLYQLALQALGPHPLADLEHRSGHLHLDRRRWRQGYLYSRAASIYGGSSEIQRNILARRVLGLPKAT